MSTAMKPKSIEIDPLIKSFDISSSSLTSWKKRSVILITIILILLVIYLIISNIAPSLKLNNKNNINMMNIEQESIEHIVGIDPFINLDECNSNESPPEFIGYHIHALFDGNDVDSISFAYKVYHNFIDSINPSMRECLFSHSTARKTQSEICYFPTTNKETDFPIPSNFIFETANYAFYVPPNYLLQSIKFWTKHHNDINYVIHTVSGCQLNDHSKWLIKNGDYNDDLVSNNLLCCHNGPALCSCNIVQYELDNNKCLAIDINDDDISFIYRECEDAGNRNIGSWRELIYNEEKNWYQIENYGDIDHPMYLCLGILNDDDNICDIGTEIKLIDCSYNQDINNNIWISKATQFKYDINTNQIKLLGCNQNNNLCVDINENNDILKLTINQCQQSTVFVKRHFFP